MLCSDKIETYKSKEFCKSIKCTGLKKGKCIDSSCIKTAKEFHHWLIENNFCISKCVKNKD